VAELDKIGQKTIITSQNIKLVTKMMKQRQKRRNCTLTLLQNTMRIMMLSYRLNFPIRKYMHPIFQSCLGILSNLVAIFKLWQNADKASKMIRVGDLQVNKAEEME